MCIFGHKYGKVEEDGFQYCQSCGKATAPPCAHKWETIESYDILIGIHKRKAGLSYIKECKKCGKLRKEEILL